MKIICVGRNYSEHIKELKNETPEEPVIFMKPDTALLKDNRPFFIPEWTKDLHYEAEVVVKINRNGKYIDEKHAHKYIGEYTLGIDFTARDVQNNLKTKGLPWELAKAFDGSAVIGKFKPVEEFEALNDINFSLEMNGEQVQEGNTAQMIFGFSKLISFVSRYFTLKTGDLLFTGTPKGVGKVAIGDELKGFIEKEEIFNFRIK